ncbi:PfkB family carbohydrate kinase [Salininema proteolyticum]|uniref:Ribokinase n=1 Tax=Salininema proteolyticum TaxID=1607685 RepID=A0ABV8TZF3_9ACTN
MDVDVIVAGSVNQDRKVSVRRLPGPGETVLAEGAGVSGGGKGANQAAAVARAGATVALVGAVGDDEAGEAQRADLRASGVDVSLLRTVPGERTGTALITVSADGENTIVVDPGANARVTAPDRSVRAAVVLTQAEIPADAIRDTAAAATAIGARFVHNAAPAPALSEIPAGADPLVVNEHEAAALLGEAGGRPEETAERLRAAANARSVVVTLGADGSAAADAEGTFRVSATGAAAVVDTTGAGDAYTGALAAALACGEPLHGAVKSASEAGAAAVAWEGARPE